MLPFNSFPITYPLNSISFTGSHKRSLCTEHSTSMAIRSTKTATLCFAQPLPPPPASPVLCLLSLLPRLSPSEGPLLLFQLNVLISPTMGGSLPEGNSHVSCRRIFLPPRHTGSISRSFCQGETGPGNGSLRSSSPQFSRPQEWSNTVMPWE